MSTKDDKKRRILEAAEILFTSRRFHEVTTDDVARLAKVGKGTIYLYFHDKDELFFETAHAGFEELCQRLRNEIPAGIPFQAQLLLACQHIDGFFSRKRQLLHMTQMEDGRPMPFRREFEKRFAGNRRQLFESVASIIRNGGEGGHVRTDIPPDVLAAFLLGMLRARARDVDGNGTQGTFDMIVDLFCNGMGLRNV
jgi:AcrR family transcriptional regulator